jgi:hypothetical protein
VTPLRYVVPFVNARGERHIVVVQLADYEVRDCLRNPKTRENLAHSYAATRAAQRQPVGFSLDYTGIRRTMVVLQ